MLKEHEWLEGASKIGTGSVTELQKRQEAYTASVQLFLSSRIDSEYALFIKE